MVNKRDIIKPRLKEAVYVNLEKSRPLYVGPSLVSDSSNSSPSLVVDQHSFVGEEINMIYILLIMAHRYNIFLQYLVCY